MCGVRSEIADESATVASRWLVDGGDAAASAGARGARLTRVASCHARAGGWPRVARAPGEMLHAQCAATLRVCARG